MRRQSQPLPNKNQQKNVRNFITFLAAATQPYRIVGYRRDAYATCQSIQRKNIWWHKIYVQSFSTPGTYPYLFPHAPYSPSNTRYPIILIKRWLMADATATLASIGELRMHSLPFFGAATERIRFSFTMIYWHARIVLTSAHSYETTVFCCMRLYNVTAVAHIVRAPVPGCSQTFFMRGQWHANNLALEPVCCCAQCSLAWTIGQTNSTNATN